MDVYNNIEKIKIMIIPRLNMLCRWRMRFPKQRNSREDMFYLDHARSGIVLALQVLALPKHSKVGVMIYNCDSVMNAIVSAGYDVVFVDVKPNLTIDMEHLNERAKDIQVLIVTHLFGIVNDIKVICERFPHLVIIEDCAHAMGCKCGEAGDFTVYSIGQGKFPSIGRGGILQVNNLNFRDKIARQVQQLAQVTLKTQVLQYIRMNIMGLLSIPMVYTWFTSKIKSSVPRKADKKMIIPQCMSNLVRGWFEVDKLYVQEYKAQQLRNIAIWKEYLQKKEIVCTCLETQNGFMLPVWSETKLPTFTHIETATHFAQCIVWAYEFGYKGDCPCAEDLVQHLTMLPCYYTLTEKQLKRQLYGK